MAVEQKITCSNIWKLFGPDEKRIIKNLDKNLSIKEVQEKTGHVVAVKDVSFSIVKGETFVVMGLSGSGKSTLILHTLFNAFNLMLNKNKSRKVPKAFTGFKGTELIDKIIDIELEKLLLRIQNLGYKLTISKTAKNYIAEKGFDKQYGARPLKRAIQKYVEDLLAEEIINSSLKEGDEISLDLDKKSEELVINLLNKKEEKESNK